MSKASFTESVVEEAALAWPESLGYAIKHGPDISSGGDTVDSRSTGAVRPQADGHFLSGRAWRIRLHMRRVSNKVIRGNR
jgi:hypothetical protein